MDKNVCNFLFSFQKPMDSATLVECVNALSDEYPFLTVNYLGTGILGKGIPLLTLGIGPKEVLYVGAHHGMEWITSILLVRFIRDFCEAFQRQNKVEKINPLTVWKHYTIHVIPMLNPDGVDYQIHGPDKEHPLYERVLKMNGGSEDFSHWQANARGVDLNHNYDAGFEECKRLEKTEGILEGAPTKFSGEAPESEPETASLCNFIRFHEQLRMVLTFHTQGEEIYYRYRGNCPPQSVEIARQLAKYSGYALSDTEGFAQYGGLTDWCVSQMNLPSFTIECGKGENPLPLQDAGKIYLRLRELLFSAPTFV